MKTDDIEAVLTSAMADLALPMVVSQIIDDLGPDAPPLIQAAHSAAQAIAKAAENARAELSDALAQDGIVSQVAPSPGGGQSVTCTLVVSSSDLDRAIAVAEGVGYQTWHQLAPRAMATYTRTHSTLTMVRVDRHSTRLFLRWRPDLSRWRSKLAPTPSDLEVVDLPRVLSPLYYGVRVVRKALGRGQDGQLGPFLGTPRELLDSLFEFAELTADDVVLDVGCGDGRVLIGAATRHGCRAIGLENDERLATLARDCVSEAGVEHLVEIRHADLATSDLPPATLAFLFLPPSGLQAALPRLLDNMPSRGRVLAHEQLALDPPVSPDRVIPIIGEASMTTASLWLVP